MIIDTTCSVIERKMKEAKENSLAGLEDDDHIQYTLSSFSDITIYTIDTCAVAGGVTFTSGQPIIFDCNVDHGDLNGLTEVANWDNPASKIESDAQSGIYIQV